MTLRLFKDLEEIGWKLSEGTDFQNFSDTEDAHVASSTISPAYLRINKYRTWFGNRYWLAHIKLSSKVKEAFSRWRPANVQHITQSGGFLDDSCTALRKILPRMPHTRANVQQFIASIQLCHGESGHNGLN